MGISNTIPPSRLIQPGVVANTAARPTSPFTGQTIYQVDTNQMLIWNGTAWVIPNQTTQNPEGLELITSVTCTSGGTASNGIVTIGSAVGSLSIGTAFSSTYNHYRISISNVGISISCQMRMTFGSTSTGYYYGNPLTTMSGGAYDRNNGSNVGFLDLGSVNSGWKNDFIFDVMSPNLPTLTKVTGFGYVNSAQYGGLGSGLVDGTTQYTSFTLTPSSGTMSGGTLTIYGYRIL
jgi:hypothetical protein